MGPPPGSNSEKYKEPLPENIKQIPGYLKKVTLAFFSRLFYIFSLVWHTSPWIMFSMLIIAVLQGALPVVSAYISAGLLNSLTAAVVALSNNTKIEFYKILSLLIAQFVCIFATSLIGHISTVVTRVSGEMVVNHVKLMMMKKAKSIDIQSYDKPDFYERLENAEREAGMRPIQILNATFNTISTLISMVSFVTILFSISPASPLLIFVLALPSAIVSFVYRKKAFRYVRNRSKDRRKLNYYSRIMTDKDMAKEIRILGLADTFTDRYNKTFKYYFNGLKGIYIKEGFWNTGVSLASSCVNCALFLYVAYMVWQGKLRVGDYSLYTGALNSIASGVAALISSTSTIYEGTLFIDNLITFMNEPVTIKALVSGKTIKRHAEHRFEFKNVSFKYPGSENYVIKDLNTVIEPGSTVVLVGVNGAGKTTLIKLLTRLYDPTEGEILLDGTNIKDYEPEELYKIFGIIFQDFGKYAVTVKENIAFGDVLKEPEDSKIEKAAKQSNATEFISRLPNGFETSLMRYFEDDGTELSIGQWQKLSVARAFYSDSDVLILDEPTASLDAIAEQEIYSQFDSLRFGKTTIFVSHRLSSATTADRILVLDGGTLKEQGTHTELMKKRGVYYRLFSTQAKRYIEQGETLKNDS